MMSQHDIEIAVPEDAVTSPYLDRVRSPRNMIEALILARQVELAKTSAAAQRWRVERDLTFLCDELARNSTREVEPGAGLCDSCNPGKTYPR
jgi:hypothetical protein